MIDEDYNLDIFQQIASTSEPTKELVTKELLICRHYLMDPKDIKCLLQWWGKYETMFPTIGFLAYQILKHCRSQIESKRFFSLVGIFTNRRKCHLWLDNLIFLIFVNKNLPSDLRVGCKPFSSLMELIQKYLDF